MAELVTARMSLSLTPDNPLGRAQMVYVCVCVFGGGGFVTLTCFFLQITFLKCHESTSEKRNICVCED